MGLSAFPMILALATMPAQVPPAPAAAPACPSRPILPAGLAGWATRSAASAAGSAEAAPAITPGNAYDLALLPAAQVRSAADLRHIGGSDSFGGVVRITIAAEGAYRVALGSGAWVDLIGNGAPLVSTGHGHGPDCTGIRKMVDFRLAPGTYSIALAGNREPQVRLMVTRLP